VVVLAHQEANEEANEKANEEASMVVEAYLLEAHVQSANVEEASGRLGKLMICRVLALGVCQVAGQELRGRRRRWSGSRVLSGPGAGSGPRWCDGSHGGW